MNTNVNAADAANQEVMKSKDDIVSSLSKDLLSKDFKESPNNIKLMLYCKLNNLLGKAEKSYSYSENLYNIDFSYDVYISKRVNRGFHSAREAQLFDVLYDFFGGKVSDEKLLFILSAVKSISL